MEEYFKDFPLFSSKRLDFVQISAENHLQDFFEIFNDENVVKYQNISKVENLKATKAILDYYEKLYKDEIGIRWGICLKNSSKVIGAIGINNITPPYYGSLGYDLHVAYWNNGIMTEAIGCVLKFAFDVLQIDKIEATVRQGNIASEKVLLKNNFKLESKQQIVTPWNQSGYEVSNFGINRQRDK